MTKIFRLWIASGSLLVIGVASVLASSSPSRAVAKKYAKESIAQVRKNISSNPEEVEDYLVWQLARPIGDDPRVLALCREVAEKGTSTETLSSVLGALDIINEWHPARSSRDKQKAQIAEIARLLMRHENWRVKTGAIRVISNLGSPYAEEAARFYIDILSSPNPGGNTDPQQRDLAYQLAIRRLLELKWKDSYPAIQAATRKYGLLDSFRKWLEEEPKRIKLSHNEKFLEEWERAMAVTK